MRIRKKYLAYALFVAMVSSQVTFLPKNVQAAKTVTTPKLTVTKKYIQVGQLSKMYIKNKVKGAKYTFTSSNKKIVAINSQTGAIRGKATGTSTIKLTAKVGKKTYTSSAKVYVKEHATSIRFSDVSNQLELEIGENVYTLSTLMQTKSGGPCTDYPFYIIPEETNTAGASVDSLGQITVTKSGSFEVIAVASDSANTFSKKIYRAQSEPLKVTVPAKLEATMSSVNQIKLTSNIPLDTYQKDDFTVTANGTGQVLKVNEFSIENDKKTVTLTMANTFSRGTSYSISLKNSELSSTFQANYGTVSKIVANESQTIAPSVATPLDYHLYDENGIDITKLYPHTTAGFEFNFEPKSIVLDEYGRITLPNKNSYGFYTIKYTYLDKDNKRQEITSNTGRITASGSNLKSLKEYSISATSNPDFNKPIHSLSASETGRKLYCQFISSVGNTIDTSKTSINDLTYVSNAPSICGIDRTTGLLYPYREGNATIVVSDGIFTQNITVTVGAPRSVNALISNKDNITLSNVSGISNQEVVHFELRDQYGEIFKLPNTGTTNYPTVRLISGNENMVTVNSVSVSRNYQNIYTNASSSSFDLTFYGKNTGSCAIEVSYGGKSTIVYVDIKQPGVVTTYKPELSKTTLDPNVQGQNSAVLKIYAVDINGIKINTVTNGYYSIATNDGTIIVPNQMITDINGETIDSTKLKLKDGTYRLTITSGPIQETINFNVKASDAIINLVPKNTSSMTVTTNDDVVTKIMECFVFYLSGNSSEIPATAMITGVNPLVTNLKVSFTSYDTRFFDSADSIAIGNRDFSKNYIGYTASLRVNKITFQYLGKTFEFTPEQDITLRVQAK